MIKELDVLPKIKPPPRGNAKLGGVLTESRETGPTCPISCPLYQDGTCYSKNLNRYHPSVFAGMRDREAAHRENRAGWIASRAKFWTRETSEGRPVRFLVHGDLMRPAGGGLDWEWINDVVTAASRVPGFRGWIYSHAWALPEAIRARDMLQSAGITFWASCHNGPEAKKAREKGFNVALISEENKAGYEGPKAKTAQEMGTDRPALVCPEQVGTRADCLTCGFCFQARPRCDLVLLKH